MSGSRSPGFGSRCFPRAYGGVGPVHRQRPRDALCVVIDAAVIDEGADREQLRQLGHAADVVAVEVGDEQVVDPRHTGELRDLEDALWIARPGGVAGLGIKPAGARKPGVDEQRLPGGRNEQRGLAPFDVDEVDVEGPGRRLRRGSRGRRRQGKSKKEPLHHSLSKRRAAVTLA